MKDSVLTLPFAHDYEVSFLHELPSRKENTEVFYFPGGTQGGKDGILLDVRPALGQPWFGCFAFGYDSPLAVNLVSSCPSPKEVCVISSGAAYIVQADRPSEWHKLQTYPVVSTLADTQGAALFFADFTRVIAMGPNGLKWIANGLSSDGIRIIGVEAGILRVEVWSARKQEKSETTIDIESGEIRSVSPVSENK